MPTACHNDEQVTTARDQATLGRSIRALSSLLRYFCLPQCSIYRAISPQTTMPGSAMSKASTCLRPVIPRPRLQPVTSMRRRHRHLIAGVCGGPQRRFATPHIAICSPNTSTGCDLSHGVAAITERNSAETNVEMAGSASAPRPAERPARSPPASPVPSAAGRPRSVAPPSPR